MSTRLSPMEHPDFVFSLIGSRACADAFPTKEAAEAFASGIRESRVHPYSHGSGHCAWVVQVGPWMYVYGIKPRPQTPAPVAGVGSVDGNAQRPE